MIRFVFGFVERMALYALIAEFSMFVRFERENQGIVIFLALMVYVFFGAMKDALNNKDVTTY